MELREYQADMIDDIKSEIRNGHKSICAVLGCGGGKSVIQGMIAKSATDKGNRVLFLVHRKELCQQISSTFNQCGVDFNLCNIGMVQTVTRHLPEMDAPKIIITDEAHHALSDSYMRIYNYFPEALRLGFTATPLRMNEGGLGRVFDSLVEGVSTEWLICNGYLSPYTYYSVTLADTSGLHVKRGDYVSSELAGLMERKVIYGDTVKTWLERANNGQTIVYCASVAASMATADEFRGSGIIAEHLDGTANSDHRSQVVEDFRNGKIKVLCNCDLFGEGFDVPDCSAVVLLRPTKSLTLHVQQSMRSMRYMPDKKAVIIDHVGNVFEHGLPDTVREWTLNEKSKLKKDKKLIKVCPACGACIPIRYMICPACEYKFEKQEREAPERKYGDFSEITQEMLYANYSNYRKCKTFEELCAFQKARKYRFGWVLYKCEELGIEIPDRYAWCIREENA